jgi:small ligand-binding sensory domain FIST
VDQGERNIIKALRATTADAQVTPPLTVLQTILQGLTEGDRQLAQHSLFIGMARDSFKQTLGPGDFLVRNVLGVDPRGGAIAIGDRVRPGQRVQFHLRDAHTSAEDLAHLLTLAKQQDRGDRPVIGALLFSCLGRGAGLYGQPNFDSHLFQETWPGVILGGFFCNGEIGPVGGNTFLHGYTSVFALIRPRWP